jgi:outer membrane protein assembly factor BamD
MADDLAGAVVTGCRGAGPSRAVRAGTAAVAAVLLALGGAGCGKKPAKLAPGAGEADRILYERGADALNDKKWFTAREYFRQVVDGYPQSPYRSDAKLGLGDTYLGEGTTQAFVLAVNEFQEFLTFYPTSPRADYAQYKLAMCHYRQMAKPERDQTETKAAVADFELFLERYPESSLRDDARGKLRLARDRLSDSEFKVGLFYYRARWYPGAIDRLQSVLKADPEYTNRDGAYYYLGESLLKVNRQAEALPWFDRLVQEFAQSEYLEQARQRVAEVKASVAAPNPNPPSPPVP